MAKISELVSATEIDLLNDVLPIVDNTDSSTKKVTPYVLIGKNLSSFLTGRNATNLNEIKYTSMHMYTPTTVGCPIIEGDYGLCVTLSNSRDGNMASNMWVFQIALSTKDDKIYYRTNINNGSWSNWKAII